MIFICNWISETRGGKPEVPGADIPGRRDEEKSRKHGQTDGRGERKTQTGGH